MAFALLLLLKADFLKTENLFTRCCVELHSFVAVDLPYLFQNIFEQGQLNLLASSYFCGGVRPPILIDIRSQNSK